MPKPRRLRKCDLSRVLYQTSSKKAAKVRKAARHTLFAPLASFPPHPIVGIDTRLIGRGPPRRWVSKRLKKGLRGGRGRRFDRRRVVERSGARLHSAEMDSAMQVGPGLGLLLCLICVLQSCVRLVFAWSSTVTISIHECPFDDDVCRYLDARNYNHPQHRKMHAILYPSTLHLV